MGAQARTDPPSLRGYRSDAAISKGYKSAKKIQSHDKSILSYDEHG